MKVVNKKQPYVAVKLSDGSPIALSFVPIAATAPDLVAPGRGANEWYSQGSANGAANIPSASAYTSPFDNDTRFLWSKLQPKSAGVYDWSNFDKQIQHSIDLGQKFSFGIMPVCSSCIIGDLAGDGNENVGGYGLGYPLYVHTAMQAEAVPDWKYSGGGNANMWIPNWNSSSYLSAYENFLKDLAAYIAKTSYKGISYSSAIFHIDIRGYGNWGEWHTYPWRDSGVIPSGTLASNASLQRIIAAHITAFPNYPLVIPVNAFNTAGDAGSADRKTGAVGYYALTTKNAWGSIGWRSDHLGTEDTDAWVPYETTLNTWAYNGVNLKDLIVNQWKVAPVVGEPEGTLAEVNKNGAQTAYYNLLNEVNTHHISQFSNENLVGNAAGSRAFYLAASRAAGYRNSVTGGSLTPLSPGNAFALTLNWMNAGNAPVYESWNVVIELRDGTGKVAASWISNINLKTLLPGSLVFTDNFGLSLAIAAGNYNLFMVIRDPNGYRKPLPLAIQGVQADGSYLISAVTVAGSTPTPVPVPTPTPAAKTITGIVVSYSDSTSITVK